MSVIKKYIEGKIQADDTNFYEVEKKDKNRNNISKDKENEELLKRSSIKKAFHMNKIKIDEDNSSRLNNSNNKLGASAEKSNRYSKHGSIEYHEIKRTSTVGSNNNNPNDYSNKNNNNILINSNILGDINSKSHRFAIIKEEKNNISNSNEGSLFSDLEEDFKNLQLNDQVNNFYNYKGNENKKYEEENSLFNNENSLNKSKKKINKNKKFFRANTQNIEFPFNKANNINIINNNQTPENFKLLLKAQENLKKKNLEKMQSFKKENTSTQDKNIEKKISAKKFNFNIPEKEIEKKPTISQNTLSQNILNSFKFLFYIK